MEKTSAFDKFAPAILQVYHRDKEAFWAAVLAPFLVSNFSLLARLNDTILVRLVDVTEARLDAFFRKDLKMTG